MKAQVTAVTPNVKKGQYNGLEITYQGLPFEGRTKKPTTRFIFDNDPLFRFIQDEVEVGQWYELEFVPAKNPKFKNLSSITAVAVPKEEPMLPSNTGKASASKKESPYHVVASMNWNEKQTVYADLEAARQANINRSVSLDHATKLIGTLVANGAYTAANVKKREYMIEETLATAKKFYAYLAGVEEEEVDKSGIIEEPEFNQESV